MSNKNKILSKYMDFISKVSTYTYYRWSDIIEVKDVYMFLVNNFREYDSISNFFLRHNLDLDKLLSIFKNEYVVLPIEWELTFKLSKKTIEVFEAMDWIKNSKVFFLSLFLETLFTKEVLEGLNLIWYSEILENMDLVKFIDDAYSDKNVIEDLKKMWEFEDIDDDNTLKLEELLSDEELSDFDMNDEENNNSKNEVKNSTKTKKAKLFVDTFWTNLNYEAKNWRLEPMIWRENELNQVIYTLLRKTKSNPLLVGDAWVWKTAIVEWLAQRIVSWDVPTKLKNKKIYLLDMWVLVAWTKFRWEFEARLNSIINEAKNPENNIILFIDEVHTIVGAWNQEWGADSANLLKPALARWEITLIWATTYNEYKKYIEKDPALTRRFQLIKVDEPSESDTIKLLEWIKYRFEDFHWVNIEKTAIEKAVSLSKRYILDKKLPDKAIDLIDEACSRKTDKIISKKNIKEVEKLEKKIWDIEKKIEKAVSEQDYFTAAEYKEKIVDIKQKMYDLENKNNTPKSKRQNVSWEDVENVIVEKYGISSSIVSKSELEFLKDIKKILNKEIIWQQEAVNEVISAIIRNKLSPVEKTKPIWTFLFLWASWVGKTYLAKLLAKHYFQDENNLITINMSEYSQDMASNKLTWSAPWYVWYEEWWILTDSVIKKPYSVVLFDEIEKGSSQVLNILLQILDNWYLEDNKWKKVDFKNTIIILTSNLWAEYFSKEVSKVWFDPVNKKNEGIDEEKKSIIFQEVKNNLPIELINRFDKIVYFNNLNEDLLSKIFNKYYKEYKKLWKDKKWVSIPSLKKEEISNLLKNIKKENSWVRWIEKYIYNDLENKVIEKLMK